MTEQSQPAFDPLASVQLMAVADELASILRHELRNKFASVRSAGFYIRRRLRDADVWQADPRLEELSAIIQDEVGLANELVNRPCHLQHLFKRAVTRVDAEQCVRRAVACSRIRSGCAIELHVDTQPGSIRVDPDELALAVRCLIENAVEATDTGGAVQVRAAPNGIQYVIEVRDVGAGIPESQRETALEPFHTTKQGHIGLGLNIARRIAQRYEGSLRFCETSAGTAVALYVNLGQVELGSTGSEP